MAGLPDKLKIPDGPEKLSLPSRDLPVSKLLKFELPPQRKFSTFADPSDYLSEVSATRVTFDVLEIPVPPAAVVNPWPSKTENPKLWNDLQTKSTRDYCPGEDDEVPEDQEVDEDEEMGGDDSDIPTRDVFETF
jgi:hypothetical protein